ncbi:unnamed protein product [Cochlearia groenlandica]
MTQYRFICIGVLTFFGFSSLYRSQHTDTTCRYVSAFLVVLESVPADQYNISIRPSVGSLLMYRSQQTGTTSRYGFQHPSLTPYRSQQTVTTCRYNPSRAIFSHTGHNKPI